MAQPQSLLSHAIQDERKRLLIDATLTAIAEHGLSGLTLAKVAGVAGLTAGAVNFHFETKEALLLATLRSIAEEFERSMREAVQHAGEDAAEQLQALVDAHFDPAICDPRKIGVWYAFMSEAGARKDYQKLCKERDEAYFDSVQALCERLIAARRPASTMNAEAVCYGLVGMLDQIWQEMLFEGRKFDRAAARRRTDAFLASLFPDSFPITGRRGRDSAPAGTAEPAAGLIYTLPAWVYRNPEFTALEKQHLFMPAWHLVCHSSDLPGPGSYTTFNLLNERAFVVRDRDGTIRAFHNVCPHRAHSLVSGVQGTCAARLTCPYHGWTFALDGRRIGMSAPDTFRPHDKQQFGLKALDCEVLYGFVFIRFQSGGMSVAEQLGPLLEEFAHYRTEDMVPDMEWANTGGYWEDVVDVDWKNAVENYLEDYHFPTGHKGLFALMEEEYDRTPYPNGVARLSHAMREKPLPNWSVQRYHKLLPRYAHLPEDMQRRWSYYGMFPGNYFDLYPDKVDFMQMLPVAPGKMMLRGRAYILPDDSRETRAARWLNDRINIRVQVEDNDLTAEVQKGLASSGYTRGILSDKEVLVRHFQDWIRERLPVARLAEEPAAGTLAALNHSMRAR